MDNFTYEIVIRFFNDVVDFHWDAILPQCSPHTRAAIYISGLRMKTQAFKNKIYFIVFQNILHEDLYTFACVGTNFQSTFSTPI